MRHCDIICPTMSELEQIKEYVRAANYLSAVQIYLQDNFLLSEKLSAEHIKPRLLGHWGTCPGANFVYANLQALIKRHNAEMMFILGPGHGFPSVQANLFIEGSLGEFYPLATQNKDGVAYITKNFSWPYGFPSHSSPVTPGVIVEGGELGYALSTAYGAVLDNPDLIVAALIGDGEAETAATATAWHLNKFNDPRGNGAVLPILHLNGYKISGPTVFGRMTNKELKSLFSGYGYEPIIVEGKDGAIYERMHKAMESAYQKIRAIQKKVRDGEDVYAPRFPMIVLKTLKGWTGIKKLHGEKIEGNFLAHQVVAPEAKNSAVERKAVEAWLRSYKFEELFNPESGFKDSIKDLVPSKELRMGLSRHAHGGSRVTKELKLSESKQFAEEVPYPGFMGSSSMNRAGLYLEHVFKDNEGAKNFRFFSPDETYSNKLDGIFKTVKRSFVWPHKSWDKDISYGGRVIEMLSEHSLQGLLQGYVLTGRHAIFASYEAFIQVVTSMVDQYAKFIKIARETSWRGEVPSLNYILTSSGWRQEHNGFSHQNPGFIDNILQKHGCYVHVYFPPDGNSTLAVLKRVLSSRNEINIIVAGKTLEPRWLTSEEAEAELSTGLSIWKFASDENPDIVLSAAGDYLTKETLAGVELIKKEAPEAKVRFVNIMEICALGGVGNQACRVPLDFDSYYTPDKPIIFNFHGYPETLKQVIFSHIEGKPRKVFVRGYLENGSTTTPFDMHIRNHTSRYHLVMQALNFLADGGVVSREKADAVKQKYEEKIREHKKYIAEHGVDTDEIEKWQWNKK